MGSTVFYNHANELATVSMTFAVDGVATDPTTVSLVITAPDGTQTTYTYAAGEVTKTATGAYRKDISCASSEPGTQTWGYVWVGTGTASDFAAGTWTVQPAGNRDLYCTPEMLKSRTGISDSYDDAEILQACRATSRWIDEHCDRVFARRTATMTFEPCDQYSLDVPDLVSVTTLKTDPDGDGTFELTWSASDFQLTPVNAAAELEPEPYTGIRAVGDYLFPLLSGSLTARRNRVEVAGVWGWPAIPEPVAEAARIVAADYLKLGSMAFGVAGYGDYGAVRARMSSPALSMLAPYRRMPIMVG